MIVVFIVCVIAFFAGAVAAADEIEICFTVPTASSVVVVRTLSSSVQLLADEQLSPHSLVLSGVDAALAHVDEQGRFVVSVGSEPTEPADPHVPADPVVPIANSGAFRDVRKETLMIASSSACRSVGLVASLAAALWWSPVDTAEPPAVIVYVSAALFASTSVQTGTAPAALPTVSVLPAPATAQLGSLPLGAQACASFAVQATVSVPAGANNVIVALAEGSAAALDAANPHPALACALRLVDGQLQVRSGDAYAPLGPVAPLLNSAGALHAALRFEVDPAKRLYSVQIGALAAIADMRTGANGAALSALFVWTGAQDTTAVMAGNVMFSPFVGAGFDVAVSDPVQPVTVPPVTAPPATVPPVIAEDVVLAPPPQANLMANFWMADFEATPQHVLKASDAASLRQALIDASKLPVTDNIEILFEGDQVASDVKLYGAYYLDYVARGGQLVLRAANPVTVTGIVVLQGFLGVGFVGPWNFARIGPAGTPKLDSLPANLIMEAPVSNAAARGGLTLQGVRGGAPDALVQAGQVAEEQYTRQVSLTLNTDLVMRDCIFRHYLEVLDASAGGRLVLLENFMVGGLDDVFFVHNSRAVQSSAIYTYIVGNVVGPGRNSPRTYGLHPDFVQHVSPGGRADDVYVDDVFFNVLLNSNNGAGYPWQFLWPGEGELPQPAARRVRAWNNIYTSGFRGISVQSAAESWLYNIATLAPGPRTNKQILPYIYSNQNFLGSPAQAVVAHNVVGRGGVDHRTSDRSLLPVDTVVASSSVTDRAAPTHFTRVFGDAQGTDDTALPGFIETLPPATALTSRSGILEWVSTKDVAAGAGFIDPKRFAVKWP